MTRTIVPPSPPDRIGDGAPRPLGFAALISISDPLPAFPDIAAHVRRLEQAGFTALFLDDKAARHSFEPLTLASALATVTDRIALVPAVGTAFNEPFHAARRLASLDHISLGRAGWLADTRSVRRAAGGFFPRHSPDPGQAAEFLRIVRGLWDSYDDDAIIADKRSGQYFRPEGRRPLNHAGRFFNVSGPLNLARSPQAHPVIFHRPETGDDLAFAALYADVVLIQGRSAQEALACRARLDDALVAAGRTPESLQIWPILSTTVSAAGTPQQIADDIAAWSGAGIAQGVVLRFPLGLENADAFLGEVFPILPRSGMVAPAEGATLRAMLGLSRPERGAA